MADASEVDKADVGDVTVGSFQDAREKSEFI